MPGTMPSNTWHGTWHILHPPLPAALVTLHLHYTITAVRLIRSARCQCRAKCRWRATTCSSLTGVDSMDGRTPRAERPNNRPDNHASWGNAYGVKLASHRYAGPERWPVSRAGQQICLDISGQPPYV